MAAKNSLTQIKIQDFSGGLNTMAGPLSLASNETPQCQNVIGYPGRLLYMGGVTQKCPLPTGYVADMAYQFYDASNSLHQCVWANGNLYDCATGAYVLIKAAVYTAGQQIGVTDQNGIMYYTTATVPLRQWDGTTEKATPNAGGTGVVPPPSGTYLASSAGSIILANPTIIDSGTFYYAGAFMYSNVNDPTTWVASNINYLGTNNFIQFILPMGVSDAGIPPTGSILIGTDRLVFVYQGALNALTQHIVNCPVGCADGGSVVYLPGADLLGSAVFLGSDYQFWRTNGVTAQCISTKILNLAVGLTKNALLLNSAQRYFASYNERYQYYFCNVGSNQFLAYRWETNAWYYINGYPSGPLFAGNDGNGYPSNFSASNSVTFPAGLYALNVDHTNFYGTDPTIFYNTAYLHGGEPELNKDFEYATLYTLNNLNTYQVQGTTLPNYANETLTSNPLQFSNAEPVPDTGDSGVWDISLWDEALWAGGTTPYLAAPYVQHGMLSVTIPADEWMPYDSPQPLRSSAASFNIRWVSGQPNSGSPALDIIGFETRYNPLDREAPGGQQYVSQSGVVTAGPDPFVS